MLYKIRVVILAILILLMLAVTLLMPVDAQEETCLPDGPDCYAQVEEVLLLLDAPSHTGVLAAARWTIIPPSSTVLEAVTWYSSPRVASLGFYLADIGDGVYYALLVSFDGKTSSVVGYMITGQLASEIDSLLHPATQREENLESS